MYAPSPTSVSCPIYSLYPMTEVLECGSSALSSCMENLCTSTPYPHCSIKLNSSLGFHLRSFTWLLSFPALLSQALKLPTTQHFLHNHMNCHLRSTGGDLSWDYWQTLCSFLNSTLMKTWQSSLPSLRKQRQTNSDVSKKLKWPQAPSPLQTAWWVHTSAARAPVTLAAVWSTVKVWNRWNRWHSSALLILGENTNMCWDVGTEASGKCRSAPWSSQRVFL